MSCSGFPALNEHTSLQLTLLFPMFSFGSPMRLKVSGSHGLSPDCTAKDFYFRSLIRETVGGWPSQGHFYPLKSFGLPIQQLLIRLLMWRSILGLVDLSLFTKKNRKYILFLTTFIKILPNFLHKRFGNSFVRHLKLFLEKVFKKAMV